MPFAPSSSLHVPASPADTTTLFVKSSARVSFRRNSGVVAPVGASSAPCAVTRRVAAPFACSSSVTASDAPLTSTAPAAHGANAAAANQIAEDFMRTLYPNFRPRASRAPRYE